MTVLRRVNNDSPFIIYYKWERASSPFFPPDTNTITPAGWNSVKKSPRISGAIFQIKTIYWPTAGGTGAAGAADATPFGLGPYALSPA